MKKLCFAFLLLMSITGFAQDKLLTKNGKITFEASMPAVEEVKAKNESVTAVLNAKTGEIASLAMVKSFRFKVALMEEHFNENYMESDKYPKATFKGKIENFDYTKLSAQAKSYTLKGKMEIHGKTKDISVPANIRKTADGVAIDADFFINTDDYDIDIPSVVSKKVSKKVALNLGFLLK